MCRINGGDAPQTLIANLSQTEAATYMANRKKYGINTLWINLLCNYSDVCTKMPPHSMASLLYCRAISRRPTPLISSARTT